MSGTLGPNGWTVKEIAAASSASASGRGTVKRLLCGGCFWQTNTPNPVLSNGTDTGGNASQAFVFPMGGADIQLVYANMAGTGPVTISAGLQYPAGTTTPVPVTWNGQTSVTIPVGGIVESDPVAGVADSGCVVTPGDTAYVNTFVSVASGVAWEMNNTSGRGQVTGTTQTNQTLNAFFSYGASGVNQIAPVAIIGTPLIQSHSVAVVGDSIFRGTYASDSTSAMSVLLGGTLSTTHAWSNLAISGFTGYSFNRNPTPFREVMKYADLIIGDFGTNDLIYRTPGTLAQFQASALQWMWACAGLGARVIQTTLTPQSSSTDGFTSLAKQTPTSFAGPGSIRTQFNDWLRAGAPLLNNVACVIGTPGAIVAGQAGHPLYAVFDMAAVVESSLNSGLWALAFVVDGIHPNVAGYAAIAAAFPQSYFP